MRRRRTAPPGKEKEKDCPADKESDAWESSSGSDCSE